MVVFVSPPGLTANLPAKDRGDMCGHNRKMPTEFVAQNGAVIKGLSTPISVSGCAETKALTLAQTLAKALKACHKDKEKSKQAMCEKQAHEQYGPVKAKKQQKAKK
jgi:hypothetical protein